MRAQTDPELAYHWIKWMLDNIDLYKDKAAGFEFSTVERTMQNIVRDPEPMHEGAVKYYKELGAWTDAMERQNQKKIEILNMYVNAYDEAITQADAKEIKVDPENADWVNLWLSYRNALPPFAPPPLE